MCGLLDVVHRRGITGSAVLQGRKLKSVTFEMIAHRTGKKAAAVNQTTDIVASHTADKRSENAGGLYPYLKTKRGKNVSKGADNIHTSIQLPARDGAAVTNYNGAYNGESGREAQPTQGNQAAGVTLV